MSLEYFDSNTTAVTSDIAFWRDTAFVGNYNGLRTYDISRPQAPVRLADFACYGAQNDPSVWDTDRNGQADLLVLSVDRTLTGPQCGAEPTVLPDGSRYDWDPNGWEGIRLFDVSNPANPVLLKSIYLDCGSHTNTMYLDRARNRLVVLVSSYPLRAGPTCGFAPDGTDLTRNLTNPYDSDPGSPADPLHGVIQTAIIPLADGPDAGSRPDVAGSAAAAYEGPQLPITYPGDPDNLFDPAEHALPGFLKMRACHDLSVFVPLGLVGAACVEQGQLWSIHRKGPFAGLPDTAHPVWVFDDPQVDFFHSATFTWDGKVLNFIDESFGEGCPPVTPGVGQTGRMFFVDTATGRKFSEFRLNRSLAPEEPDYCSAHLGNVVASGDRYLLVNAWYTGGVDVIDFTDPRRPREVAYYDRDGDEWSAYWYEQRGSRLTGPLNIFATHGVEHIGDPDLATRARGFESFLARVPVSRVALDHLNPQVQEFVIR
jgi:hypothetical protein